MSDTDTVLEVTRVLTSKIGKLWWTTEIYDEAARWRDEAMARGAISVEIRDQYSYDVIVTLWRDETANFVAGYKIDDVEWLLNE